MKIQNNVLIYENQTCWNCKGAGIHEIGVSCPLYNKPVNKYPNKKCPHCGAKNKNDHKTVEYKNISCNICDGVGKKMEDKFDNLPQDIYAKLNFEVISRTGEQSNILENIYGFGVVGGCTDYGKTLEWAEDKTDKEIIEFVISEYTERQVIGFLQSKQNDNKLCEKYGIFIGPNGWNVKPLN